MNRNHLQIIAPQGSELAARLTNAGNFGEVISIIGIDYIVAGTTLQSEQCQLLFDLVRK